MSSLDKAISQFGGLKKLSSALGVSYQAIQLWGTRKKIPAERVIELEKLTGVPRYELRPDIYPPEEYDKAA